MFGVIYKITNTANGKIYVGKTTKDLCWYFDRTLRRALWGISDRPALCNAIRFYGRGSFKVEQIAVAETEEELNKLETRFIFDLRATDYKVGYNIAPGGDGVCVHSPEARAKMSARLKGVPKTKQHVANMRAARIGFRHSEESKAKMSASRKGKTHDRVWVEKVADAIRGVEWPPERIARFCVAQQARRDRERHINRVSSALVAMATDEINIWR